MSKIRFVRVYKCYGSELMDVIYDTERIYTMAAQDAPKTVKKFMEQATRKDQYDPLYKRNETIYE